MIKEIKIKIENLKSIEYKIIIETEIEVLDGIDGININETNGDCCIKFEEDKISEKEIFEKIKSLGFSAIKEEWNSGNTKEHIYKVEGMHCASCEILIEKKLLEIQNIKSVDASTGKGEVVVEYEGDRPNPERLSRIFREENYSFSDDRVNLDSRERPPRLGEAGGNDKKNSNNAKTASPTLVAFNIAIFIIIAFLILDKMGIANFLSLSSSSSLIAFFGFGLLAGLSSCAALVGGIVLSMSKQWNSLYSQEQTTSQKLQPHIMFNAGRVVSYAVLGGVLGVIGSRLQISPQFTGYLVIAISLLMIALGLQMLGVKAFRKFQITAPKSATRYIANEKNFQGKQMPFIMGALTFFLPCGFTITAQSLALLSGNAFTGAAIMGAFALGTVPALFFIGLSSVKFNSRPHLAERFAKVAGFLVLFFALYNMSNQATVLGFTGFSNPLTAIQSQAKSGSGDLSGAAPIVDGKQVIKMTASGSGDNPNYFKVRAGVPVRWEITGANSLGCNGAIISNSLFSGAINLTPGQVSVKEFTPQTPGKYAFSCTMGMIKGVMEVVNATVATNDQAVVPSGAKGCGCGGGGGNSCGGN